MANARRGLLRSQTLPRKVCVRLCKGMASQDSRRPTKTSTAIQICSSLALSSLPLLLECDEVVSLQAADVGDRGDKCWRLLSRGEPHPQTEQCTRTGKTCLHLSVSQHGGLQYCSHFMLCSQPCLLLIFGSLSPPTTFFCILCSKPP